MSRYVSLLLIITELLYHKRACDFINYYDRSILVEHEQRAVVIIKLSLDTLEHLDNVRERLLLARQSWQL